MSKTKHSGTAPERSTPRGVKIWPAEQPPLPTPQSSTLNESYFRLEAQLAEINALLDTLGSVTSNLDGEGSPTMFVEPAEGHFAYRLHHLVEMAEGVTKNMRSIIDRLARIV